VAALAGFERRASPGATVAFDAHEGGFTLTPEEVVRAELGAWDRLDLDAAMSFFTPDAVWDNVRFDLLPGRTRYERLPLATCRE
jgi:hypothetical protein